MTCFIAVSYIDYSHCLGKTGKISSFVFWREKGHTARHGLCYVASKLYYVSMRITNQCLPVPECRYQRHV
ncbi:Uncharacterised protein [Hafnia alvei]|nr:Uncharacterised protein [Hafnia alvei]